MAEIKLFGYANKISVKPGDEITFHVNADGTDTASAQLVRLVHGDHNPQGPGYIEEEIRSSLDGAWAVKKQFTQVGSYLTVADPDGKLRLDGSFTLCAFIWAGHFGHGRRQAILGRWDMYKNEGYCLGINQRGILEFWQGDGKEIDYLAAEVPLDPKVWYFIAVTFDASSGVATLHQANVLNRYNSIWSKVVLESAAYDSHVQETLRFRAKNSAETPFLMAGAQDWHELRGNFVSQSYNGKIDRPAVFDRALSREELDRLKAGGSPPDGIIAYWDTTKGYTDDGIGDTVYDVGPSKLDAQGVNRPVRAQTGYNWGGKNDCFRLAPNEYGGVEFHEDAIIDSKWEVTKGWTIPADLKSGIYAARLRAGDGALGEEHIVFFVRATRPRAPICFLVPTASYLAYANERLAFDAMIAQPITGQTPIVSPIDIEVYQSREFGMSTYDSHIDGAGVCYTSYLRPVINMRPKYRIASMGIPWQFPADLSIIAWLEHMKYDYEIVTDEDLDLEGLAAIRPYNVVITGTHPEYYSEKMLDATEDYLAEGGRLVYMGGNGYYWNVAFRPDEPAVMEVRKLDSGMRAWNARPGEHYLQTTGQKSGLWKNLARPPQKLAGVGFISQGFEFSSPYRRMPDSWHRTVDWIMAGVEGEIIGDQGLAHGGAAGIEIDRYDLSLGTPPHAKIMASSGGHPDNYMLVCEEILYAHPGMYGTYDYRIRADMVYFTTPKNGAVFSPASIAFGQALPVNNFKNNVSTVLKNVVDAFAKPGELPGGKWISEEKQWR
jgi:N,N-dimethylformamidase